MSARPRREPFERRDGRYGEGRAGRGSSPWVIRSAVGVAVVILVAPLVYAALHGVLFSLPKKH